LVAFYTLICRQKLERLSSAGLLLSELGKGVSGLPGAAAAAVLE